MSWDEVRELEKEQKLKVRADKEKLTRMENQTKPKTLDTSVETKPKQNASAQESENQPEQKQPATKEQLRNVTSNTKQVYKMNARKLASTVNTTANELKINTSAEEKPP